MNAQIDPSDTARFDLAGAPIETRPPSLEDTTDLNVLADPGERQPNEPEIQRFADGILRFYRARSILSRGVADELSGLAWSYLSRLEPAQLPGVARPAFFELAYFVRLQRPETTFDHAGFRLRVLDVAVIIDGYLDDTFRRAAAG